MFFPRSIIIFTSVALAVASTSGNDHCATVGYAIDGTEHCVDPCVEGQFVFSREGVPLCPQNLDDRPCPTDCVGFDDSGIPYCTYTLDDRRVPCRGNFIHRGESGKPECFEHCATVKFFQNKPICLKCKDEDVYFDQWQYPACYDKCESVFYGSDGSPLCLHCSSSDVHYDSNGDPSCFEHCKSVAYFMGNPVCLNCSSEFIKYDADGYPICQSSRISSSSSNTMYSQNHSRSLNKLSRQSLLKESMISKLSKNPKSGVKKDTKSKENKSNKKNEVKNSKNEE